MFSPLKRPVLLASAVILGLGASGAAFSQSLLKSPGNFAGTGTATKSQVTETLKNTQNYFNNARTGFSSQGGFNVQGTNGDGSVNIAWPSNIINFSELQNIFSQYPGLSQLNIQFPNNEMLSNVTPQSLQNILGTYQQEAQSMGVEGKLPDLSFSSLALSALQSKNGQLPLSANGNIKEQMDNVLSQFQSQNSGLLNALPDWLRQFVMSIYNAVYSAFEFLGTQLASIVAQAHR